ncbi:hypothetical protein Leryth_003285 [Lithospermum erythrorhizon]|nr:hypothetical protein Leryth_003285 [Lithospermum erythrorhizon]
MALVPVSESGYQGDGSVVSEREDFGLVGPLHLTTIDWKNPDHRRSVAACLVQGVYIIERDRQEKRLGPQALAPPWWNFCNFQLHRQLVDDADQSVFGAIYQFSPECNHSAEGCPKYVIAFRGTVTKGDAFTRDVELDVHFIRNDLHRTSRYEAAIQAVRYVVATFGSSNVWLAGHSLGSAIAMLAGKNMAKTGVFLESFLLNPPFVSAPIEKINDTKVKSGIRIASSFLTAGFAVALKNNTQKNRSVDTFAALSAWLPSLFVNPADHICSEYIGYFEHRKRMEGIGASGIEKLATQYSIGGLLMNAIGGKEYEEPLHLIPSANVIVNLTPSPNFKDAHGIHQWWRPELQLDCKTYQFR